jgi:hypothetical protein
MLVLIMTSATRYKSGIYLFTNFYYLFMVGLPRGTISSTLERVSKAALLDSYRIWLGREGSAGSGGER